jgi:hypothetical protein
MYDEETYLHIIVKAICTGSEALFRMHRSMDVISRAATTLCAPLWEDEDPLADDGWFSPFVEEPANSGRVAKNPLGPVAKLPAKVVIVIRRT